MAKIMIVDDMIVLHEILKEILNLKGHKVVNVSSNGDEAIDYIKNNKGLKPDLIIMDHRMPGKDGVTTLKEILAIDSSLKVIFVSADETARINALAYGAIDYLIKPFTVKSILLLLEKLQIQ